jgi:peptide/nickel transport system substrate-binding protein
VVSVPARAQTLRMGVGAQITSIDPHFHNLAPNNAFAAMVFGRLLETDGAGNLAPSLATSWRAVGEDVWEFKLREGVTFHDGTPFTADDFAFTVERIPQVLNSPGSFRTYTNAIKRVEVVDAHTLRVHTNGPYPLLASDLALVPLLSRKIHTGATTERFNSGELAIGTGPFRLTQFRHGERADLARYDGFWGDKPHWARVDYRIITSAPTRASSILAGDVDFIDQVPTADVERLRASKQVVLSETSSLRYMYLAFDHSRTGATPFVTTLDGKPIDPNPLKDVRVRRALSLAIDRDAIVRHVMEGVAVPINQVVPPGTYGYTPELSAPKADQAEARRLLAEAGFPNGFAITLHGSNDRYPNDAKITQAIGQMWTRAGVRTAIDVAPFGTFVQRASRQEFSAFLVSWGNATGDPTPALRSTLATFDASRGLGSVNRGRYSNPEFDNGLIAAMRELDSAKRERMLQQITNIAIGQDVAVVPLHMQKNVWAMRPGLRHDGRVDESTRAQDVHPVP